jgi:cytidyltransferase-like protein
MKKIVLATGGFDPLHSGHLECFNAAKTYGDILAVGVNSDAWLTRKKGRSFMPISERLALVSNIKCVDLAFEFNDDDNSAIGAIRHLLNLYPDDEIIFANGGDRTSDNIPEMSINDDRVKFEFGVGGSNKANSSSWILTEWKSPKTERVWGYYRVLHDVPGMKVKELTVNPGCSLSMQMHNHRSEYWIVSEGKCEIYSYHPINSEYLTTVLYHHSETKIKQGSWHQLRNPFDEPCRIVEIQYGEQCIEEDIIRK